MLRSIGPTTVVLLMLGSCGSGQQDVVRVGPTVVTPVRESARTTPTPGSASGPELVASNDTETCTSKSITKECQCKAGDTDLCLLLIDALFRRNEHDSAIIQSYTLCEAKEVAEACFQTADYMDKLGISRRLGTTASLLRDKGVTLLREGCSDNDARACFGYGKILFKGKIVAVDVTAAEQHVSTACNTGHAPACSFLANVYETGSGGLSKDKKRALVLLQSACQLDHAPSCTVLGDRVASVDKVRAKSLYEKACADDDANGCARLALAWAQLGEDEKAHATLLNACELGHSASCVDAGALTEVGKGTSKAPARARELYLQACEENEPRGCFSLAALVAKGVGGARNWGQAVELYQKSCAMEFKKGCKAAARLKRDPPNWRCTTESECEVLCAEAVGKSCLKLGDLRADREAAKIAASVATAGEAPLSAGDQGADVDWSIDCADAELAYEMGCGFGDAESCLRVGKYQEACDAGASDGCVKVLAKQYQEKPVEEAIRTLALLNTMCVKRKNMSACIQHAVLNRSSYSDAQDRLTGLCKRGNAIACRLLASAQGAGSGSNGICCGEGPSQAELLEEKRRDDKAWALMLRACVLGDLEACTREPEDEVMARAMDARWRELIKTRSCGRSGLPF